jgi:uncharacterized protein YcbK (DUF882 family)
MDNPLILNKEKLERCKPEIITIVKWLEQLYKTITINSGFRTKEYNAEIGGVKNSYHCQGLAVDVSVKDVSPIKVCAKLLDNIDKFKCRGFGLDVYKGYLHIDCRPGAITYWVYSRSGLEA